MQKQQLNVLAYADIFHDIGASVALRKALFMYNGSREMNAQSTSVFSSLARDISVRRPRKGRERICMPSHAKLILVLTS